MIRFLVPMLLAGALPLAAQPQQIPAGTTTGLTVGTPAPAAPKKILHEALTPKTRATLQAAMDATPEAR